MKCPTCGAENDPANRFCDQCGTRLDQPAAPGAQGQEQTMVAQPVSAATVCPTCGAPVLPGEAFCDNCGSALTGPAPDPSSVATAAPPSGMAVTGLTCPACGSPVEPGDAFCDNCGASLAPAPTAMTESAPIAAPLPSTTSTADNGAAPVDATTAPAPAGAEAQAAPTGDAASGEPSSIPVTVETATPPSDTASTSAPAPEEATPVAPDASTAPDTGAPTTPSADSDGQAAYEASRQQLDDEITRQQGVITQLEGVQSMLGAATPAGVLQSLDEARAALAKAQVERDTLQPPAPAVDPAEVARLNDEITRQQGVITQLEGVQSMLGAATPAGVLQSLDEARAALAKAQSDLQGLGITASGPAQSQPASSSASTAAPPATEPAAAPVAASEPAAPSSTATAAPEAAPAVAPTGPRLTVDESGAEIALPPDKSEYVIGREDPISGIFPEVDLTPHGGENGGVSRQHARLLRSGGQWMLTDLNSTNHTRVDGTRLEPNTPTEVKDGSKLQFGRLALTFHA